jgi:hypothetical protein
MKINAVKKEEPAVDNIIIKFRALLALMSNNKDYGRDRDETLPAKRTSDDPSTPTGKTTTSLTKEDEPTLPAVTPSNIRTKAAHKKKVIVVSPSPAKKPHDDESLSTRVNEAGQSFKDKVTSLGKKRPKLKQKRKQD